MSPNQSPFGVHEVHKVAILLTASSLDSSSSSSSIGAGSPTFLIPESPLHDARSSLGPSHGTLTVKFAPLPQVDPNRKRSLAPLGVPGRSRRMPAIQQEGGSLWSADPDVSGENMEDPIVSLAKFVKKASKMLWRRVRKGSKAVSKEDVGCLAEPVLDIKSTVRSGDVGLGEKAERVPRAVGLEVKRGRRASWTPLVERGALGQDKAQRRSTGDLPHLSVPVVP